MPIAVPITAIIIVIGTIRTKPGEILLQYYPQAFLSLSAPRPIEAYSPKHSSDHPTLNLKVQSERLELLTWKLAASKISTRHIQKKVAPRLQRTTPFNNQRRAIETPTQTLKLCHSEADEVAAASAVAAAVVDMAVAVVVVCSPLTIGMPLTTTYTDPGFRPWRLRPARFWPTRPGPWYATKNLALTQAIANN